jgi:hypothetical protein
MFCQLIGRRIGMIQAASKSFLLGLLLDMPIAEIHADFLVNKDIRKALLGFSSRYRPVSEWFWECISVPSDG